jgi:protein-tyrosine-phosphatase
MTSLVKNILILCTGNSARSILAEVIINHRGQGRCCGFSAGSQPKSAPHPLALEILAEMKMPTANLRSKSWDEFAGPDAPHMNFIFTVCDNAAGEVCPVWPGHPATAHWGLDDPAAATGTPTQQLAAFRKAFQILDARIAAFMALPFERMNPDALNSELNRIGGLLP